MKRNVKRLNTEWLAKVTLAVALILSCSNAAVADTTIVDGNTIASGCAQLASVEFDDDTEYNGSFGSRRKKSTWEDDDAEEEENYQ